jgi:nucleotide-binding universal stress UspA family protein
MKNVLLPTDFSDNAWNATKYAIELFKDEECVFHLLNTYTPAIANSRFMATSLSSGQLEDGVHGNSERGLKNVLNKIDKTKKNPRHSFKTISSFSLLVDEIKEIVEKERIDLIVTGTKGASGLDEVFMGSNTVRIIKSIKNSPVLAIPQYFEYKKLWCRVFCGC